MEGNAERRTLDKIIQAIKRRNSRIVTTASVLTSVAAMAAAAIELSSAHARHDKARRRRQCFQRKNLSSSMMTNPLL